MELTSYQQKKKDYIRAEILRRIHVKKRLQEHWHKRADVKAYLSEHPIRFINDYVFTYDPRNLEIGLPTKVPMNLFKRQEELVHHLFDCMENQDNALIDKSRDMGLTWVLCAVFVHRWLYEDGFKAGIGSRKLDLVDKLGEMDAILPKIRFIIRNLPEWLKPKGYNEKKHSNYCKIYNPDQGSLITGEGGTDIGRGGRNTVYFVDEHAKIDKADQVDASLSQNTNCIIYGSTPHGMGNLFAKKRFSRQVRVFTMHWKDHPFKNEAWYIEECKKYDEVTIAQELDIDYTASVEGICIPAKWVRKCVKLNIPKTGKKQAGVDVGGGTGTGESVYIFRHGGVVCEIEVTTKVEPTGWALQCASFGERDHIQELAFDAIGVGAGVKGAIDRRDKPFEPKVTPVQSGARPSKKKYDDNKAMKADERFANLRAEMWWAVRERFRKTSEFVDFLSNTGQNMEEAFENLDIKPDELISIPDDNELITQLSLPTVIEMGTGKTKIESKKDLAKRGIASPDRADALVYSFSDIKTKKRKPVGSYSNKPVS